MKKAVFITGAQAGTGYSIAERFAKDGWDVFITSRTAEKAEAAARRPAAPTSPFWRSCTAMWTGARM
jgi:NAD(P)-dependent dehydrogenase (short-subunit alcohol dehydrogenase family)